MLLTRGWSNWNRVVGYLTSDWFSNNKDGGIPRRGENREIERDKDRVCHLKQFSNDLQ